MSPPILATERVSKSFNGLTAVNSISYQLAEKETAGIIGPNGAGKSTFFNLLTGLYIPDNGRVLYQGEDITRMPACDRVTRGIARTFQLVSVFDSLLVLENMILARVRLGPDYASKGRFFFKNVRYPDLEADCLQALKTLGIDHKAETRTADLSYGEKRELEIAIALSLNPKVLLLDEPFAGLSLVEIVQISEVIKKLKGKFALVIVEHKISKLMDLVERLGVINEGQLICDGPPETVINDSQVRECYWGKEEVICY